jgi:peptidoglycan hydrolase-like protein with peptidoglycan-binding domain
MSNVITPTNTPSLLTPSGSATPTSQLPTLRRGDKNNSVKLLQTKLGVEPLGTFGPKTDEAVRIFQKRNGLVVDGVVGSSTWEKLNGLPNAEIVKLATITSLARPTPPPFKLSTEALEQLQIKGQNNIANLQNQALSNVAGQNTAGSLVGGAFKAAIGGSASALGDTAKNLAQGLGQNLSDTGKNIADNAKKQLDGLKDVGKNLKDAFPKQLPKVEIPKIQLPKLPKFKKKELPEPKKEKKRKLKDRLAAAKSFGKELKDTAAGYKAEADKIKKAAEKAKADLQNTVNQATNAVQNAVSGVTGTVGNIVNGTLNTITDLEGNVSNAIANVPGTLTTNLMTNLSKVQEEQLKKLQESSKEAKDAAQPKFNKANEAMNNAKKVMESASVNTEQTNINLNKDKIDKPPTIKGFTYEWKKSGRKPVITAYIGDDSIGRLAFDDKSITEQAALSKFIELYKNQYENIETIKRR